MTYIKIELKYGYGFTNKISPEAIFLRLPLSIVTFHLLQTSWAWKIVLQSRSLSIFSIISGGKMFKLVESFIFFAFPIVIAFLKYRVTQIKIWNVFML